MREVYVDESSQSGHSYMVLGAAVVPGAAVRQVQRAIDSVLEQHRTFGEFKWTKVSQAKLPFYRDLIAAHFGACRDFGVTYSALIVDCTRLDHRTYNEGDAELGFNKFLFQLLHHRVSRRYAETEKIVVYLDSRTAGRHPMELQLVLNRAAARHFKRPSHAPYSRVVFRDSKTSRILQMVDLITGAISWHKNDRDTRPEASPHKSMLANEIAQRIHRARLGGDTGEPGLNVWNFQLRAQRRGAR